MASASAARPRLIWRSAAATCAGSSDVLFTANSIAIASDCISDSRQPAGAAASGRSAARARLDPHGKGHEAADDRTGAVVAVLGGRQGQGEVGKAAQQGADGDLALQPGQRGTEAEMEAVTEGDMAFGGAGHVQ